MKQVILVGLGEFGTAWYETLQQMDQLELIVVDKEESNLKIAQQDQIVTYTTLERAIELEQPDFIVNLTPPVVHNQINNIAFENQVPVLSEKPIADNYFNAVKIVEKSERKELPFVIAANYRNFPIVKRIKEYITSGVLGDLQSIDINLKKEFKTDKEYFKRLEKPLLFDVAIHHFDLVRYLTDNEVSSILANNFNPDHSWFAGDAANETVMELTNDVAVRYEGSLVAREEETDWLGDWIIEGNTGVIKISHHQLKLIKDSKVMETESFIDDLYLEESVKQFIDFLDTGNKPSSSAEDYIKTQALIDFAAKSSTAGTKIHL